MESVTHTNFINTGILVLAAGRSSRLGRPKQLLVLDEQTLLKHTLQEARRSAARHIAVVLGAYSAAISGETVGDKTQVVINSRWEEGIASSVRCGLSVLVQENPSMEGVILMVCDQPFVSAGLIDRLITKHQQTGKRIVASAYDGTCGPPVFFHRSFFPELMELNGDTGGKGLILGHLSETVSVDFPEGSIDIDTEADYQKVLNEE
ncbi:MAG TPA: nucleotidyltransferase family protein [Sphingobacteriaceae bacterium]